MRSPDAVDDSDDSDTAEAVLLSLLLVGRSMGYDSDGSDAAEADGSRTGPIRFSMLLSVLLAGRSVGSSLVGVIE